MKPTLYQRSIEIILNHQDGSGAYIACPNFSNYAFCWLRDGSFTAYSMDVAGQLASARAFHGWVDQIIQGHGWKVERLAEQLAAGQPVADKDFLFTRYTLDGHEDTTPDDWGNFQYDGYGTWLWALAEHVRLTGDDTLLRQIVPSVRVVARYLGMVWRLPGYDCWEEHPEYLHPYSLAAAYAGLIAASKLLEPFVSEEEIHQILQSAADIRAFTLQYGVYQGQFSKSILPGDPPSVAPGLGVDSSLTALCTPYSLADASDPIFTATLAQIEKDLHAPDGGVYRYPTDTYYGGGEWILLTAWLGWQYTLTGQVDRARGIARWIENQADPQGELPEQVSTQTLDPRYIQPWVERWGVVASPLLWSHAMYIILIDAIERSA